METPKHIGPYRVDCRLGAGGMGVVYRAYDAQLDRSVAIKCLLPTKDQHHERFDREAKILARLARLAHPRIVQVHHTLEHEGTMCIVMEYVDGSTLRQRIARHGPLPVGEAVRLGRQIAEGMAAAHREYIIHRDLKSENVLLDRNGNAKVTDFGVAKVVGDKTLTEKGQSPGTLQTMSPEQLQGKKVTTATDLFSFGILLYEALAGELPFTGNIHHVVDAIIKQEQPSLSTRVPGLPDKLHHLIGMLLQKHPDFRPDGFGEVIDTLKRIEVTLDDDTAALTAPSVPAPLSDDEPTEDPVQLAPNAAEGARASAPVDPGQAQILSPLRDNTSRRLAASESSGAVPARVPRTRKRLAVLTGAILVVAALAYTLWPMDSKNGHSGPHPILNEPAPDKHTKPSPPLPAPSERFIAVLRPQIAEGCMHDVSLVRRSIRTEIEQELYSLPGVDVIPDEDSSVLQRSEMSPRELAHALDADELLVTRVECYPSYLTIELRRLDSNGVFVSSPDGPLDMEVSDIAAPSPLLRRGIRDLYAELGRTEEALAEADLPSLEDLVTFQRLRQDYWQSKSRIPDDELLRELNGIIQRAPAFLEAYLFAAEVEEYRHRKDQDRAHLQNAQALLEKALQLAPSPRQKLVRIRLFSVALGRGDIQTARNELSKLEDKGRNATSLYLGALLTEKLDDPHGARQLLQEAASRHPSWRILYHQARLAFEVGDIAAAEYHLHQVFERSPGNDTGRQLQWEMDLVTHPRDTVQSYYLLPSAPSFSVRSNQALKLMSIGEYSQAIELLEAAHAERPSSLATFHSLAEAWKLEGEHERADEAFEDILALLDTRESDPFNEVLRAQVLAHLGRADEARQSIDHALKQGSRYIKVQYAAAATYALIGEPDRAAQRALSALDGGYAKEWFHYPWFEAMRARPLLRDRF